MKRGIEMRKTLTFALFLAVVLLSCGQPGGSTGNDKSAGAAVATPTLMSKTHNSVTVSADAPANGQTVEYARNSANTAPTNRRLAIGLNGVNALSTMWSS